MSAQSNGSGHTGNKVEFVKQGDNEILIRTHRENGEVIERTAIIMPPDHLPAAATKADHISS